LNNLTYRSLLESLGRMSDCDLDSNVTVVLDDEFFPVSCLTTAPDSQSVLDVGHPILLIEANCDDCAVLFSGHTQPCLNCKNKSEFANL